MPDKRDRNEPHPGFTKRGGSRPFRHTKDVFPNLDWPVDAVPKHIQQHGDKYRLPTSYHHVISRHHLVAMWNALIEARAYDVLECWVDSCARMSKRERQRTRDYIELVREYDNAAGPEKSKLGDKLEDAAKRCRIPTNFPGWDLVVGPDSEFRGDDPRNQFDEFYENGQPISRCVLAADLRDCFTTSDDKPGKFKNNNREANDFLDQLGRDHRLPEPFDYRMWRSQSKRRYRLLTRHVWVKTYGP